MENCFISSIVLEWYDPRFPGKDFKLFYKKIHGEISIVHKSFSELYDDVCDFIANDVFGYEMFKPVVDSIYLRPFKTRENHLIKDESDYLYFKQHYPPKYPKVKKWNEYNEYTNQPENEVYVLICHHPWYNFFWNSNNIHFLSKDEINHAIKFTY